MNGIHKKDIEMIKILKKDGRISDAEIARRLKLSKTTIRWRRMKLIQEKKIMIIAVMIYDNIGYSYARVGIKLKKDTPQSDIQELEREFIKNKNIYEIFEAIGTYDIILGFCAEKAQDLYKIIHKTLRGRNEIMDYDVSIFMKSLKVWGIPI